MVDRLCADGVVRSAAVEAALRRVPRHLFVPGTSLEEAYADEAVHTKHDPATGVSVSAASQPRIVAMMLEQLQAAPGMRVLELGAGTGYNAALLAALVGPEGRVTTVDVDDDLVTGARDHLAAAGAPNVEVVLGDGALGHPDSAPYDRIIATVGAYEVPTAWLEQLAPGGRLVVPLRSERRRLPQHRLRARRARMDQPRQRTGGVHAAARHR
ncbi:methyltransferase domain-containing protein [Thermobifida halotolerans]|uniref:methyltransferase domain-containing protein n=1 Tax=Thermobifida halotolerans TaxID=483545 RepID=UPI00351377BB